VPPTVYSHAVRHLPFAALWVLAVGCSSSATSVRVQVDSTESPPPTVITVSLFDRFGLLGRSRIDPAPLPGALKVMGLPDSAQTLTVVAVGDTPRALAGVRFDVKPHSQATAKLLLALATPDGDGDGVPDMLDDCPTTPDPDQNNSDGEGAGDACGGVIVIRDLAAPPGSDLAVPPGSDLALPPDLSLPVVPLFSDGFENGIQSPFWTTLSGAALGGTVTVDGVQTHGGSKAVHVHQNALGSGSADQLEIAETSIIPLPDLYLRVFMYAQAPFDATNVAIFELQQSGSPFQGVDLNLRNGSFNTFNNVNGGGGTTVSATTPMPTNTWVCLEWHVQVANTGFAKLLVDGAEVTALSGTQDTQPSPTVSLLAIGLISSPANSVAARDVWFDDLVIDNKPIGCL
jgi:polysaccharide lyase-like protein